MLRQEVSFEGFKEAFKRHGREKQFSAEGFEVLYNYFEEIDEEVLLDVIDICCSITEISLEEFNTEYEKKYTSLDQVYGYLEQRTEIIGVTENTIVFFNF